MSASVRWSGLTEFLREFRSIPQTLRREGMEIVREETLGAAADMVQAYGRKTGRLARGIKVEFPSSSILAGAVVNTAPHSHLWEWGSRDRYTNTKRTRRHFYFGRGRYLNSVATGGRMGFRGRMPAKETMVPIVQRRRRQMARRLEQLLRDHGFQVGSAG